jgi:MoaA/NifB/PqqE/SkfB family radical SAM enzyme
MISPYNEIRPCCITNEKVGDLTKQSLETAWNSEEMKRLRLSMTNEAFHPVCAKCYELEKVGGLTVRKMHNSSELAKFFPLVEETNSDGSLDDFKLRYIDLRFSNLCNLRCRTCNHHSSSKWYQDEKKLNPDYNKPFIMKAGRYELDVWEQILPHIDSIERIYFAGGEPLLMEEHYWLLEELEKRKKFDVTLFYNTNFTAVKQKQRHLFDYWKNFTKIGIGASLDASGARAEYLRKDTQWSNIVDNIVLLKKELPHINFKISCTVSIFNSLHICDFHKESVEQGLITIDEFTTNLVLDPEYQRLDIAPNRFREKIKAKYIDHISWLNANGARQQTIDEYYKLIEFINKNDNTNHLDAFKKSTQQIDNIRNENLLTVFPELKELFDET